MATGEADEQADVGSEGHGWGGIDFRVGEWGESRGVDGVEMDLGGEETDEDGAEGKEVAPKGGA